MKIKIGKLEISIARTKSNEEQFTLNDIHAINETYINYINSLNHQELQNRIAEITVENINTWEGYQSAQKILRQHGIVVIPSVIERGICRQATEHIKSLFDKYSSCGKDLYEDEVALFQVGQKQLKGYQQLSEYEKAVINLRYGQDEGMVDIFNCDYLDQEALTPIRRAFEREDILRLMSDEEVIPHNLNTYMNFGITQTRGFHIDCYHKKLKGFIYLTDVKSLKDGPYTYVRGSHQESPFRRANSELCRRVTPSTESPIIDPKEITPILASQGSLVISDQSGIHRGWPQSESGNRMVAVMNCIKPKSSTN
jgi:hypothetical protein